MSGEPRILVTNDDGVHSTGLRLLYEAVKPLGRVYVLAPEASRSACGLGLTLNQPLRITRIGFWDNTPVYVTNGVPGDVVYLALEALSPHFDLVVSGINIGDNTSLQAVLASGTIGAAVQAALANIPAASFSIDITDATELEEDRETWNNVLRVARTVALWILQHGLPQGVDILNINFPRHVNSSTRVKVATMARTKFTQKVTSSMDPWGRKIYWLYGSMTSLEPGTDVYTVHVEKAIALTPLTLDFNMHKSSWETVETVLDSLAKLLEKSLK